MLIKRLKSYFLSMEKKTETYKEMYEGRMMFVPSPVGMLPWTEYDNSYYYRDRIIFSISQTNKLKQDMPTVLICIPMSMLGIEEHDMFTSDYCLRRFCAHIDELNKELYNKSRPNRENGKYYITHPGGEVLVRNASYFAYCPQKSYINGSGCTVYELKNGIETPDVMCLCFRMTVQLPLGKLKKAMNMLCVSLPSAVDAFIEQFNTESYAEMLRLREKQVKIREWLKESDYCAFVANGSILPRMKGTELPMKDAVPFISPEKDEITICGVRGMGIKRGVTVITGGGYSGKSTLLCAISAGIYDHTPGDGRELCITDSTAVTISSEDGRSVKNVNISPFIKWIPGGDTHNFSTDRASGSTSQAANIMEAVSCGAKLLLIDEDRSATNFMIRDKMMKELIEKEPITPFTDRVNELYGREGVSTILVIGGSGEYLSVADKVYIMNDFIISDATERSKSLCVMHGITPCLPENAVWGQTRVFSSEGFTSYPDGSGSELLWVSDMGAVIIGDEKILIHGLHDLATTRQADALGYMLRYLEIHNADEKPDIIHKINDLYEQIEKEGLDIVYSGYFTEMNRFLDLPRKQELKALIYRMRNIKFIT